MELDVVTGTAYNDTVKLNQKTTVTSSSQQQGLINLNIAEMPTNNATLAGNQIGNEQSKEIQKFTSEKQIKEAITSANNKMKEHMTRCEFSYHEESKRVSIKVIDRETDKVIKEIPPEKTLEMVQKMWEMAGLLVDEKR